MVKVLFVCLGNICRSPMAEAVFRKMVNDRNLENKIFIDSAATSSWEEGNPVHHGTRKRLAMEGISVDGMYSRQLNSKDSDFDYIVGMDKSNISNIKRIINKDAAGKVKMLLEFAGVSSEIDDPYYTGNFDKTYNDVMKGCSALLELIIREHNL